MKNSTVNWYWLGYRDAMAGKPKRKLPASGSLLDRSKRKIAYNNGYSEGKIHVATPF